MFERQHEKSDLNPALKKCKMFYLFWKLRLFVGMSCRRMEAGAVLGICLNLFRAKSLISFKTRREVDVVYAHSYDSHLESLQFSVQACRVREVIVTLK